MAATSRAELLELTRKEYQKLKKLNGTIAADFAMEKREDDISIKDVVGHRAHWIDLFLGWYSDGLSGKKVFFPAEGYKWNDLKRYNADLRKTQGELDWSTAKQMLDAKFDLLIGFIEDHSDEELYGGPMKGANNKWTPGRWAEAAGPSHFRSASKFIRGVQNRSA